MNDKARQTLKKLVDQHGSELVNQPGRVKGLLLDLCAGQMRETKVLVAVVQRGMAKELHQDGGRNLPILIPRMAISLYKDDGLDQTLARWAVETWAMAFGFALPGDQGSDADSNRDNDQPGAGSSDAVGKQGTPFKEEGGAAVPAPPGQEKGWAKSILSFFGASEKQEEAPRPGQSHVQPKHGEAWTEPYTGMEFVWVPGGSFEMGDLFGDGYEREKPVHTVELDGFWLGKYPVTQAQWEKVMGNNPSHFKGRNNPVECVSWQDVQEFISKLNSRSKDSRFCLPTEAQWEYAARSGGKWELYAGGNDIDRVAWYFDNSGGKTHPVGQKAPNGLGIYDMTGNVWEWCHDWFDENYYARSPRSNPSGPSGGSYRVDRGGGWDSGARGCRAAIRLSDSPGYGSDLIGLRLAFTPGQQ
jgi:formylglycine-generating enzyme required for sulfatase activity